MDTQSTSRARPRPRAIRATIAVVAAVLLAGCGGVAGSPAAPVPSAPSSLAATPATTAAPTSAPNLTPTPGPPASPALTARPGMADVYPHEAADLEAIFPAQLGGRELVIWSIRGESMMNLLDAAPAAADQLKAELVASGHELNDFVQVIAGRADTDRDPPYFVYAFEIPEGSSQTAEMMALAAVGFSAVPASTDLQKRTVGGKEVLVGSIEMVRQDEHQRGRPYVYEATPDLTFFVITDDEAWAAEALAALP